VVIVVPQVYELNEEYRENHFLRERKINSERYRPLGRAVYRSGIPVDVGTSFKERVVHEVVRKTVKPKKTKILSVLIVGVIASLAIMLLSGLKSSDGFSSF